MVLKNNAVASLSKRRRNVQPQLLTAGASIGRETNFAANRVRLMKQTRVGCLTTNTECYQRDWVRMYHRSNIRSRFIDRFVKWKLRRRWVQPFDRSIGAHTYNIASREVALVDAGRRNPDIACLISDRKITTGRRRHAISIDAVHRVHDLIAWMDQVSWLAHLRSQRSNHRSASVVVHQRLNR